MRWLLLGLSLYVSSWFVHASQPWYASKVLGGSGILITMWAAMRLLHRVIHNEDDVPKVTEWCQCTHPRSYHESQYGLEEEADGAICHFRIRLYSGGMETIHTTPCTCTGYVPGPRMRS